MSSRVFPRDTEASLKKRVAKARYELSFESRFDSVLVNDLLDVALKEAEIFVKDFLDIVDNDHLLKCIGQ